MQPHRCSLLSIAPYYIVPPVSGGQLGICIMHHYLGQLAPDIVVSTDDNSSSHNYSFHLQKVFPSSIRRYIPFYGYRKIAGIAKAYDATHIMCEHPYMAPLAILLSKRLGLPWFMRSHNIESERFRALKKPWWRLLHLFEKYTMLLSKGVFFVTQEDGDWAKEHFNLPASHCHVAPFGTELKERPVKIEGAKQQLAKELGIDAAKPWLYFLGGLMYKPNADAVSYILNEVMPRLNDAGIAYEVLLAGKGLGDDLQQQVQATPHATYVGFVPHLDSFLAACDVMLNPVLTGGGIKTKAVEALAYNKTVVSSHSGAAGLMRDACGSKLIVAPDYDWDAFANGVAVALEQGHELPSAFYEEYYWGNIAARVLKVVCEH